MRIFDENGNEMTLEEAILHKWNTPYVPGSFADPTRTAEVEAERAKYVEEHGPFEEPDD